MLRRLSWGPDRVARDAFERQLEWLIADHMAYLGREGRPLVIGPHWAYRFYYIGRRDAAKAVVDQWRRSSLGNAWNLIDPSEFNGWALKHTATRTNWNLVVLIEISFRSEHDNADPREMDRLDERASAGEGHLAANELVDAYYQRFPDLARPAGL